MDAMTLFLEPTGLDVTYYRHGQGKPLLFLHAILGLQGWEPVLDALSTSFDVIAPHTPGWGPSQDWDVLDGPLDIALFYDDFLQAIGIQRACVLGVSIGAWMAAELAAIFPQRVQKLMLFNPLGMWFEAIPGEDPFAQHPMNTTWRVRSPAIGWPIPSVYP